MFILTLYEDSLVGSGCVAQGGVGARAGQGEGGQARSWQGGGAITLYYNVIKYSIYFSCYQGIFV